MKFTFKINKLVQLLAVSSAVAPQIIPVFGNPQTQAKISAGAVAISAIAGLLAHFSNPDGSPAPATPPSVPKMPSDWKEGGS